MKLYFSGDGKAVALIIFKINLGVLASWWWTTRIKSGAMTFSAVRVKRK